MWSQGWKTALENRVAELEAEVAELRELAEIGFWQKRCMASLLRECHDDDESDDESDDDDESD
jgi:hypothetical protein